MKTVVLGFIIGFVITFRKRMFICDFILASQGLGGTARALMPETRAERRKGR